MDEPYFFTYITSLIVIELILDEQVLIFEDTIIEIMLSIYQERNQNGLVINQKDNINDIEICCLYLSILSNPHFKNIVEKKGLFNRFNDITNYAINWIETNFNNDEVWHFAFSDTIPYILSLKKYENE